MQNQRGRFGYWARGERIFHKGDFKYLILDLLKDNLATDTKSPRDENQFNGFFPPEPGAVYPTLPVPRGKEFHIQAQDGKSLPTPSRRSFLVEK
jgi:hypothetical protein